ncbi:hypothetical protein BTN50_0140 [Candidatus Enterovibrio altilux]|uniref:Mobile element protein n=1 Tax=Candidatus Enterovibrio altilux TaxID=1927128 RepID=A0A291B6R9_9GAMM|nr:hypothetical protein BTN50_0140 [Candidatus Enterovibrio luxaltus]
MRILNVIKKFCKNKLILFLNLLNCDCHALTVHALQGSPNN